jgi:hypothetical protein
MLAGRLGRQPGSSGHDGAAYGVAVTAGAGTEVVVSPGGAAVVAGSVVASDGTLAPGAVVTDAGDVVGAKVIGGGAKVVGAGAKVVGGGAASAASVPRSTPQCPPFIVR